MSNKFDRQVRFFGVDGQRELQRQRVAVVGCGGLDVTCSWAASRLPLGPLQPNKR